MDMVSAYSLARMLSSVVGDMRRKAVRSTKEASAKRGNLGIMVHYMRTEALKGGR